MVRNTRAAFPVALGTSITASLAGAPLAAQRVSLTPHLARRVPAGAAVTGYGQRIGFLAFDTVQATLREAVGFAAGVTGDIVLAGRLGLVLDAGYQVAGRDGEEVLWVSGEANTERLPDQLGGSVRLERRSAIASVASLAGQKRLRDGSVVRAELRWRRHGLRYEVQQGASTSPTPRPQVTPVSDVRIVLGLIPP